MDKIFDLKLKEMFLILGIYFKLYHTTVLLENFGNLLILLGIGFLIYEIYKNVKYKKIKSLQKITKICSIYLLSILILISMIFISFNALDALKNKDEFNYEMKIKVEKEGSELNYYIGDSLKENMEEVVGMKKELLTNLPRKAVVTSPDGQITYINEVQVDYTLLDTFVMFIIVKMKKVIDKKFLKIM